MLYRPKLLLIVAQSGRMLAQSAAREGYTVRVADCFADRDTLGVADRYLRLPPLDKTSKNEWLHVVITLSAGQPCSLICGTGVERFYPLLPQLPAHIQFAGSCPASIEQLCDPTKWITLLDKLSLPHPATKFTKSPPLKGKWLAKSSAAWGGTHIMEANSVAGNTDFYYQQQIVGTSASVLFLADRHDFQVLLINQQFPRNIASNDFSLTAIASGLLLNNKQHYIIQFALQQLTQQLELSGLMSLDFMLDSSGEVFLLEVNPRPTASCQLLPAAFPFISWQLTCSTSIMPAVSAELPVKKRLLRFCFAPHTITIPAHFDWPDYCYDLPTEGSIVHKDTILCSLLLEQDNTDAVFIDAHQLANQLIEDLSA